MFLDGECLIRVYQLFYGNFLKIFLNTMAHWRDVLFRNGTSSARLRDSVAGLCHRLCNSIVP